jgi:tetratricopeptide (TPR) repeat protein
MVQFHLSSVGLLLSIAVLGSVVVPEGAIAMQPGVVAQVGDGRKVEADKLLKEGDRLVGQQQFADAKVSFEKALVIYRSILDRKGEGYVLRGIGNVYSRQNDYGKAIEYQEKALAIAREIKEPDLEARSLNNLGAIYREMGKPDHGISYLQEALKTARTHNNYKMEVMALQNLGIADDKLGKPRQALEKYEQALEIDRRFMNDSYTQIGLLYFISQVFIQLEEYSKAEQPSEEAVEIARKLDDKPKLLEALRLLAGTYFIIGNRLEHPNIGNSDYTENPNTPAKRYFHRAFKTRQEALQLAQDLKQPKAEAEIHQFLSEDYAGLGDLSKSVEIGEKALMQFRYLKGTESSQLNVITQMLVRNYQLADRYAENLDYVASEKRLDKLLALVPEGLQLAKSVKDLKAEKSIIEREGYAYYRKARTFDELGEFEQAKLFASKALASGQKA